MTKTLAIDCMGGDYGPSVIIPAAISALQQHSDLKIYLVGPQQELQQHLKQSPDFGNRLHIQDACEVIGMSEKPSTALRRKPNSSMRKSLELVRDGHADACVSSGNTGALMALATVLLGTLPGIERPAITAELPNRKGTVTNMLDLGANIDASAEQLTSFAIMGHVFSQLADDVEHPRVALLNIGEEAVKGRDSIKLASDILSNQSQIDYVGYIEANQIYDGNVDVIVCDGFTGNNVLKACEGITRFLYDQLKTEFTSNWWSKAVSAMVWPILRRFQRRINPDQYNGASLLGLREIVIKSHGSADSKATLFAINKAITEIERQVPQAIQDQVAQLLLNTDNEDEE
ncbi:phosphate acyltransferase PlsX [Kangiella japonica]|uniref:Phosphate acyltransferase n=1 Tax=Kangiella japonica TaxID=647384 RepID=A0ABP3CPR3_9GAMM